MLTNLLIMLAILQAQAYHCDDKNGAIGVRIGILNHRIQRVYPGTPAEKAGLLPGDKIVSVCDEDYRNNIAGMVGSEVIIVVKRNHEEFVFHIKRASEMTIVRK